MTKIIVIVFETRCIYGTGSTLKLCQNWCKFYSWKRPQSVSC